jgi:hypothetical protein
MSTSCLLIPHFTGRSDRFDNGVRRGATEAVKVCQDVGSFVLASGGLDRPAAAPLAEQPTTFPGCNVVRHRGAATGGSMKDSIDRGIASEPHPSEGLIKSRGCTKTAKVGGHNVW